MKIISLETFPVSVPYKMAEQSSIINRGGVSDVIIKLTTDTGLVGWGEACKATDTLMLERGIRSCEPFLLGKDPWNREAILHETYMRGLWHLMPMIGNSITAAIDLALWDLCGKDCGQPLYRMLGGARRTSVNYSGYVRWNKDMDAVAKQTADGVKMGYDVFYLKSGIDEKVEEQIIRTVREVIGPDRKIRIDSNMAWLVPDAIRLINRWHAAYNLDFAEAPVRADPIECMLDVRRAVTAPLSANENLWREGDVVRMIRARVADFYCFSPQLVGTIRRFTTLAHLAEMEGALVCKHTRGELGICASAMHHILLATPNISTGHQQNATRIEGDVVKVPTPITTGPEWGLIEAPGLGVEIDEEKLKFYHENFVKNVDYAPYGDVHR